MSTESLLKLSVLDISPVSSGSTSGDLRRDRRARRDARGAGPSRLSPFLPGQARHRARSFVGSPETVREQITRLAERAGVNEVMVSTMTHSHADRRRSYTLLAEAFARTPAAAGH